MKYFLILINIILFCFSALSQNSGYRYEPLGHASSYEQGYYYTHAGEKISGLIKWECSAYSPDLGANYILFKSAAGEKKVRLTTKDVKAFVIGKDSFTIIKAFSRSDLVFYDKDFVRVVSTGFVTLYSHCQEVHSGGGAYGMTSTGIECFYYLKKDNVLYRLKRKDFKTNAICIFGDNTELMNKITKKEIGFDNIEWIVAEYNAWYEKKNTVVTPTK